MKTLYAAMLGAGMALPMAVMAQEPAPQTAPQATTAPASDALTKDQEKAQKKQQKANEKAARDQAKAAKEQEKSVKQQDKATNAAEKAKASTAAAPGAVPQATTHPQE